MDLNLYLPPDKTAIIQLYGRTSGSAVGSPITGAPDVGNATLYVFDVTQAAGDYTVALTGVSVPAGPRFVLRKTATAIYVAETWEALEALGFDPAIPASTPPQVTGYWRVYNEAGVVLPATDIVLQTASVPETATGYVLEDATRTGTTDGLGVVSFTGLFPGATYIAKRSGSSRRFYILVPATATSPVALKSMVG